MTMTLNSPRMLLMRLAAETTVDAYLLTEDENVVAMIRDGAKYEELFEYVSENY